MRKAPRASGETVGREEDETMAIDDTEVLRHITLAKIVRHVCATFIAYQIIVQVGGMASTWWQHRLYAPEAFVVAPAPARTMGEPL